MAITWSQINESVAFFIAFDRAHFKLSNDSKNSYVGFLLQMLLDFKMPTIFARFVPFYAIPNANCNLHAIGQAIWPNDGWLASGENVTRSIPHFCSPIFFQSAAVGQPMGTVAPIAWPFVLVMRWNRERPQGQWLHCLCCCPSLPWFCVCPCIN